MSLGNFSYDAATALSRGHRDRQEDAVVADFSIGSDFGFAVLADGMGGHAAGEIASGIVVTEVFSELKLQSEDSVALEQDIKAILQNAVTSANQCVRLYAEQNPASNGMGTTLVAPVIFNDRLYWISVGDSPLYLYRGGLLQRLNEDHSMAPRIAAMHSEGLISLEGMLSHPDSQCLTSVLAGAEIPSIDCRATPYPLCEDDILIAASDGLQFLSDDEISDVVTEMFKQSSAEIAFSLLHQVEALDDPDQDNVSLCVVKLSRFGAEASKRYNEQPAHLVAAGHRGRNSSYSHVGTLSSGAGSRSAPQVSSKTGPR